MQILSSRYFWLEVYTQKTQQTQKQYLAHKLAAKHF